MNALNVCVKKGRPLTLTIVVTTSEADECCIKSRVRKPIEQIEMLIERKSERVKASGGLVRTIVSTHDFDNHVFMRNDRRLNLWSTTL